MKFKNIQNKCYQTTEGKTIWASRSIATHCLYFIYKIHPKTGKVHKWVALGQRGPKMIEANRWNLPGGFLDWNEILVDGCRRELFEELGLNLKQTDLQLWEISDKLDRSQNVSFFYVSQKLFAWKSKLPKITIDGDETIDGKWVPIEDLKNYDICFNHDFRIAKWLKQSKVNF